MAENIDNYEVQMSFDASEFEQGVERVIDLLDQLGDKLEETVDKSAGAALDEYGNSVDKVSEKVKNVPLEVFKTGLEQVGNVIKDLSHSFDDIGDILGDVSKKFQEWGQDVANSVSKVIKYVENLGSKIVDGLTLDPVKNGFKLYERQIESAQVLKANTGKSLDEINAALDSMNQYANKTVYNFTQMSENLGKWTAQGIELDKAIDAIEGMANAAALSGATPAQFGRASYYVSRGLGGSIRLMQWKSLMNANMGTKLIKDVIIETAKENGVDYEALLAKSKQGTFEDTLQKGWLTSDIFQQAMAKFNDPTTELGKKALEAATKPKTFTQLMGVTVEALQTGWATVFRSILGDLEQGEALWSRVYNALDDAEHGIIARYSSSIGEVFNEWAKLGGRDGLIEGVSNAFHGLLDILLPVKDAFVAFFPAVTGAGIKNITDNFNQTAQQFHGFASKFRSYFGDFVNGYEKVTKEISETVTSTQEDTHDKYTQEELEALQFKIIKSQYGGAIQKFLDQFTEDKSATSKYRDKNGNLNLTAVRNYLNSHGFAETSRYQREKLNKDDKPLYKNNKTLLSTVEYLLGMSPNQKYRYYEDGIINQEHYNSSDFDSDIYHTYRAILGQQGIDTDKMLDDLQQSVTEYKTIQKEIKKVEDVVIELITPASDVNEKLEGSAENALNLYKIVKGVPNVLEQFGKAISGFYQKFIKPITDSIVENGLWAILKIVAQIVEDLAVATNYLREIGAFDKFFESIANSIRRNISLPKFFTDIYEMFMEIRKAFIDARDMLLFIFKVADGGMLAKRFQAVFGVIGHFIRDKLGNTILAGGLVNGIISGLRAAVKGFFNGGLFNVIPSFFKGFLSGALSGVKKGTVLDIFSKLFLGRNAKVDYLFVGVNKIAELITKGLTALNEFSLESFKEQFLAFVDSNPLLRLYNWFTKLDAKQVGDGFLNTIRNVKSAIKMFASEFAKSFLGEERYNALKERLDSFASYWDGIFKRLKLDKAGRYLFELLGDIVAFPIQSLQDLLLLGEGLISEVIVPLVILLRDGLGAALEYVGGKVEEFRKKFEGLTFGEIVDKGWKKLNNYLETALNYLGNFTFEGLVTDVKTGFGSATDSIYTFLSGLIKAKEEAGEVEEAKALSGALEAAVTRYQELKSMVENSSFIQGVGTAITALGTIVTGFFKLVGFTLVDVIWPVITALKTISGNSLTGVKDSILKVVDVITTSVIPALGSLASALAPFLGSALKGLGSGILQVLIWIGEAAYFVQDKLEGLKKWFDEFAKAHPESIFSKIFKAKKELDNKTGSNDALEAIGEDAEKNVSIFDKFVKILKALGTALHEIGKKFAEGLFGKDNDFSNQLAKITEFDTSSFTALLDSILEKLENFQTTGAFQKISETMYSLGSAIGTLGSSLKGFFDTIIVPFFQAGKNLLFDVVIPAATSILPKLASAIGLVFNAFIGGLDTLTASVKDGTFEMPSIGDLFSGFVFKTTDLAGQIGEIFTSKEVKEGATKEAESLGNSIFEALLSPFTGHSVSAADGLTIWEAVNGDIDSGFDLLLDRLQEKSDDARYKVAWTELAQKGVKDALGNDLIEAMLKAPLDEVAETVAKIKYPNVTSEVFGDVDFSAKVTSKKSIKDLKSKFLVSEDVVAEYSDVIVDSTSSATDSMEEQSKMTDAYANEMANSLGITVEEIEAQSKATEKAVKTTEKAGEKTESVIQKVIDTVQALGVQNVVAAGGMTMLFGLIFKRDRAIRKSTAAAEDFVKSFSTNLPFTSNTSNGLVDLVKTTGEALLSFTKLTLGATGTSFNNFFNSISSAVKTGARADRFKAYATGLGIIAAAIGGLMLIIDNVKPGSVTKAIILFGSLTVAFLLFMTIMRTILGDTIEFTEKIKSSSPLEILTGFLNNVSATANKFIQDMGRAAIIKSMAIGLGVLAVAIVALSFIPFGKIVKGFLSMLVVVFVLSLLADVSANFGKFTQGAAILTVVIAINVLVGALKRLSKFRPEAIIGGLISLTAILAIIGAFLFAMDKIGGDAADSSGGISKKTSKSIKNTAFAMVLIAIGIKTLAGAVAKLGKMDFGVMMQGLFGVGLVLLEFGLFVNKVKNASMFIKTGIAIAVISLGLSVLIGAVKRLGKIEFGTLIKGLISVLVLLRGIRKFIESTRSTDTRIHISTALSVIAIAAALRIMVGAVKKLGQIKLWTLIKGLVAVFALFGAISDAAHNMQGGTVSFGTMIAGIALIAEMYASVALIQMLGEMKIDVLAKGVGAFALLILSIGGALKLMSSTKSDYPLIKSLITMLALMGSAIAALWFLNDKVKYGDRLLKIAEACSMLIIAIGGITALFMASDGDLKNAYALVPVYAALVGMLFLFVLGLKKFNILSSIGPDRWKALSFVLFGISGAIIALTGVTTVLAKYASGNMKAVYEFIPSVAIMAGVLFAFVYGLMAIMKDIKIDPGQLSEMSTILVISGVMIAALGILAGVLTKLELDPIAATKAALGIAAFVAVIGALLAALNWLYTYEGDNAFLKGVSGFLKGGVEHLGGAIEGIADFAGRVAGAFSSAKLSAELKKYENLASVSEELTGFSENIKGFIAALEDVGTIETPTLEKFQSISDAVDTLTSSSIKDSFSKLIAWFTGDKGGIGELGAELGTFGENLAKYDTSVSGISKDIKPNTEKVADAIKILSDAMPEDENGLLSLISASEYDVAEVGKNLKKFGGYIKDFSGAIKGIDNYDDMATIAGILGPLSTMVSAVLSFGVQDPTLGLFVPKSFDDYVNLIPQLGTAITDFVNNVNEVDKTKVDAAIRATDAVKKFWDSLDAGDTESLASLEFAQSAVSGMTTLSTDLKQFVQDFAEIVSITKSEEIEGNVVTFDGEAILDKAIEITRKMTDLAESINKVSIPDTFLEKIFGDNTFADFGTQIAKFAEAYVRFVTNIQGLQALFTDTDLEEGLTAITDVVTLTVTNMTTIAESIPEQTTWLGKLVSTTDNSLSTFGSNLESFGRSFGNFVKAIMEKAPGQDISVKDLLKTQDDYDTFRTLVDSAMSVITSVSAITIPDQGSLIGKLFVSDTSLKTFGTGLGEFGVGFATFCENVSRIEDFGIVEDAIGAVSTIISFFGTNSDAIPDDYSDSTFGKSMALIDSFNVRMAGMLASTKNKKGEEIIEPGNPIFDVYEKMGVAAIERFAMSADNEDGKAKVTAAGEAIGNIFIEGIKSTTNQDSANETGEFITMGMLLGAYYRLEEVFHVGEIIGDTMLAGIAEAAEVHSPSKKAWAIGKFIVKGLANGVLDFSGEANTVSGKLGKTVIDTLWSTVKDEFKGVDLTASKDVIITQLNNALGDMAGKLDLEDGVLGKLETVFGNIDFSASDFGLGGLSDALKDLGIESPFNLLEDKIGTITGLFGGLTDAAGNAGGAIGDFLAPLTGNGQKTEGGFLSDLTEAWTNPDAMLSQLSTDVIGDGNGLSSLGGIFGDFFKGTSEQAASATSQAAANAESIGETISGALNDSGGEIAQAATNLAGNAEVVYTAIDDMARRVIRGEFGNGNDRVNALRRMGLSYEVIQNRVNALLGCNFRYATSNEDLTKTLSALEGGLQKTDSALVVVENSLEGVAQASADASSNGVENIVEVFDELSGVKYTGSTDKMLRAKSALEKLEKAIDSYKDLVARNGLKDENGHVSDLSNQIAMAEREIDRAMNSYMMTCGGDFEDITKLVDEASGYFSSGDVDKAVKTLDYARHKFSAAIAREDDSLDELVRKRREAAEHGFNDLVEVYTKKIDAEVASRIEEQEKQADDAMLGLQTATDNLVYAKDLMIQADKALEEGDLSLAAKLTKRADTIVVEALKGDEKALQDIGAKHSSTLAETLGAVTEQLQNAYDEENIKGTVKGMDALNDSLEELLSMDGKEYAGAKRLAEQGVAAIADGDVQGALDLADRIQRSILERLNDQSVQYKTAAGQLTLAANAAAEGNDELAKAYYEQGKSKVESDIAYLDEYQQHLQSLMDNMVVFTDEDVIAYQASKTSEALEDLTSNNEYLESLGRSIHDAKDELGNLYTMFIESGVADKISSTGKEMLDAAHNHVTMVKEGAEEATAAINELSNAMEAAGINAGSTLTDSTASSIDAGNNRVAQSINGMVNTTKDVLKIHSPSRVFDQIGSYCGEGFLIGLTSYNDQINQAGYQLGDGVVEATMRASRMVALASDESLSLEPTISPIVDTTMLQRSGAYIQNGARTTIGFDAVNVDGFDKMSSVAADMAGFARDNRDVVGAILAMRGDIANLGDAISGIQLVMDDRTVAGKLTSKINANLGQLSKRQRRGNL